MKTYCIKDKCPYRIECGSGKYMCSIQSCKYIKKLKSKELPNIKWAKESKYGG